MKLAEQLGDLDPELARRLEEALDSVKKEFEEKLTATVQEAVADSAARADAEPATRASEEIASSEQALDSASELRLATLDIDVATSQAEILEALSRSLLRFASRVVIFVNRASELHGWSASGFGDSDATIKQIVLAGDRVGPEGSKRNAGSIALSPADCRIVCDALGADPPSMGLLMPFVLGSQVVGTIYCDRVGDAPFSVPALQLLTYIAGQTLETLPVRKRSSTATLNLAAGSSGSTGLADSITSEAITAEPEVDEIEPPAEPEPEPAPVIEPEIEAAPEEEGDAAAEEMASESETPTGETDPQSAVEVDEPALAEAPTPDTEAAAAPELPLPAEDAMAEMPGSDEEATRPGFRLSEPVTTEPTAAAPTTPPMDAVEPSVNLGSTSVNAPDDVEGPGWAFTAPTTPNESNTDSKNEEAQRLARLLVTEIKLYNEEAVEEGRRSANVYARLREDIDRSRQIFEDRIDESTRAEDDYFKQALVKILAGGDPALLGI